MNEYKVIGLMSGTSMDGVDLAYCIFKEDNFKYTFEIKYCETIPYTDEWYKALKKLPSESAYEYAKQHVLYGHYLGNLVSDFINKHKIAVDFVASHGHTVFHQPHLKFTSQIGEGAALAQASGQKVVCDFRTSDVAAGGQGAPLVPIGDEQLFGTYDYCLNLGGFANISMAKQTKRVAFDICPANIVLNYFANFRGKPYDRDGKMAANGIFNKDLYDELNSLDFYEKQPPKSLGREWMEQHIMPLFDKYPITPEDCACTFCEHVAYQIGRAIENDNKKSVLVTGGGAFNAYLIERIQHNTKAQVIIPQNNIVNYKEALIFAFLGVLRIKQKNNCLSSVTGAAKDVCGGALYLP